MFILLENFNASKYGLAQIDQVGKEYQQLELNQQTLKTTKTYNDLVKVAKLIIHDEPINNELYLNQANPVTVNFWLNDGVKITKFYKIGEDVHHIWTSKLGYLINSFEDEDFKEEFLDEVKLVYGNDLTGFEKFKTEINSK